MEESGDMVFNEILDNFIKILENIPGNLKGMCMILLYFFSTIDICLTIYKNIDNPDFNYIKWAKMKILNIGFIILAIKSYEWFLNMVKSFFLSVGVKGLALSLGANNYFNNPSAVWDKGREIGGLIIDQLGWRPSTYIFILLSLLAYIGFFLLALKIIICWVEYYFLTGFCIVFLPFGALELGIEYYKNVFKTIISCSIKLSVFNMWLLICDKLMKSIMVAEKTYDLDAALVVCGTVYVLVAIMLSMPSITTSLLTGSPTLNAGTAMAGATAGVANTYRGTKEALYGAWNGMKTGGKVGVKGGAIIGGTIAGPVGVGVGKIVGGALGAVGGATIGGSYSGARYAAFKEKGKRKSSNGELNNKETSDEIHSTSNNQSSRKNENSSNKTQVSSSNNVATTGTTKSSETNIASNNIGKEINISDSSSLNSKNNIDASNSRKLATNDSPKKSGIKVNGGKEGKLPDWMGGDY